MKIKELLTDSSKWTTNEDAKTSDGISTDPNGVFAVCWCLDGALQKCYPDIMTRIPIRNLVKSRLPLPITRWNDAPERTFDDVKKLVEELDI